ncbi:hypothetical protein P154DRAFT_615580 [Amniculicola lignicola CBS 123094]|uniref:Apple domain-containing protein n=1 Tax=Amniculicola lignicola CBS 123094 TaxID=1392246 RepID=A0A6A5WWQ7_9PLEO|nr:hypothetical protein P154DRAFT_615580 [Amniculicola lignicola CBS 123094]
MFSKAWLLVVLLAVQEHVVLAGNPPALCYTNQATTSPKGPIPTTTTLKTIKLTQTVCSTKTPSTTKTPQLTTVSTTVTSTTVLVINVPQITDTFTTVELTTTTTTVEIPTQTITSTESSSTTTTETSQAPTVTVSTIPGWLPIRSTLPGSSLKKRSLNRFSLFPRGPKPPPFCGGKNHSPPKLYPSAVTCFGVTKTVVTSTITRTAKKTQTITAPTPTTTLTSTAVETSTSFSTTPNAQTTITETVVITTAVTNAPSTTTTTTTTATSTIIIPLPAATTYPQCDSSNFAYRIGSLPITGFADTSSPNALGVSVTSDTTVEDCCLSCAKNPGCSAVAWYVQSKQCVFGTGSGTCTPGQYRVRASAGQEANTYVLMNGRCGQFYLG